MDICDKLISESQERMLLVCNAKNREKICAVLSKWDLESEIIGEVNMSGKYQVFNGGKKVYEKPIDDFDDPREDWALNKQTNTSYQNMSLVKKSTVKDETWTVYDNTIGCRVVKGPLEIGHYSILNIDEIDKQLIITWGQHFLDCYNTMIQKCENVKPLCLINCLNYGHPKDHMMDIDVMIKELNYYCKLYKIPIVGGNVSLYNTTDGISILPTPIFVMVGIC